MKHELTYRIRRGVLKKFEERGLIVKSVLITPWAAHNGSTCPCKSCIIDGQRMSEAELTQSMPTFVKLAYEVMDVNNYTTGRWWIYRLCDASFFWDASHTRSMGITPNEEQLALELLGAAI